MGIFSPGIRTAHTIFSRLSSISKRPAKFQQQQQPPLVHMCVRVSVAGEIVDFSAFFSRVQKYYAWRRKNVSFKRFHFICTPTVASEDLIYSCSINHGTFDFCKCTSDVWPVVVVTYIVTSKVSGMCM